MTPEICDALRYCPSLPTPPRIAIEIVELCRDPNIDMAALARLLAQDPALASRVLRASNSVFYGQRRRCQNLRQAMLVIGLNATMTLALSFSLAATLSDRPGSTQRINFFWRRSLISASAGRLLGELVGHPDPDQLFLAGLLQDIGILALDAVMPAAYGPLLADANDHDALRASERETLGTDHGEAGAWLMGHWGLPEPLPLVATAVHDPDGIEAPEDIRSFVSCVTVAATIADLFLGADRAAGTRQVADTAARLLGLGATAIEPILSQVAESLPDIAALYDTEIISAQQSAGVIDQAREILAVRNLQLLQQIAEQQHQMQDMERATHHLRETASRDALTGLYNRRHFDEILTTEHQLATENGWPLTLGFIDLDHFKTINDTYGHLAGDAVLARVAHLLEHNLRKHDFIMRYGGDEFVALLPGTGLESACKVFERLRQALAQEAYEGTAGTTFRSTVSIGLASHMDGPRTEASALDLVRAADRALYRAKAKGRNCLGIELDEPL